MQRFSAPAAIIIGEKAAEATLRYVAALARHFKHHHTSQFISAALAGQEYSGLLVLSHFATEDEGLNRLSEITRHRIHGQTTARRISDETIERKVAELHLPIGKEETAALCQTINQMRDILQEAGEFAPGGVPLPASYRDLRPA
jgi:hypothetical protein